MRMTTAQALQATRGRLVGGGGERSFAGVTVDSRRVSPEQLFVAIRGGVRDGHDFVGEALLRGARGVVVERWPLEGLPDGLGFDAILVDDTLHALGQLAAEVRRGLRARIVAITGTAGKTSSKEMVVSILRAAEPALGARFAASERSENNLVGLPTTILRLEGSEAIVVLEMGMNALGEIARLTEIADPDIGLVTNIGIAHLSPSQGSLSLGAKPTALNSLEGVIQAKGELWAGMRPDALAVVNLDDANVTALAQRRGGRQLSYSLHNQAADVRCEDLENRGAEGQRFTLVARGARATVELAVAGEHNLSNALGAAALALALELPLAAIAAGLGEFKAVAMRSELLTIGPDIVCINDAYNANLLSMKAALRMLVGLPAARRIAALGDMREMGEMAAQVHREVGLETARLKIDLLMLVGEHAAQVAAGAREGGMAARAIQSFASADEMAEALREVLRAGDRLLVKASHAVGLDKVVARLAGAGGAR